MNQVTAADKKDSPNNGTGFIDPSPSPTTQARTLHRSRVSTEAENARGSEPLNAETMLDVIDRGMISIDTATKRFATYINDLIPHYPAVIPPQGITASKLRESKQVLFLAMIAAAALGGGDADLSRSLNEEILRVYADRIFIKGEKSQVLVQSLLVTVGYYFPPASVIHLQFYQYTHIAATMA